MSIDLICCKRCFFQFYWCSFKTVYRGNYEQFHKTKTEKLKNQQREYEAQQQLRSHVQEFIDRFRYNANRASSVQSKIKMLEKLWVNNLDILCAGLNRFYIMSQS